MSQKRVRGLAVVRPIVYGNTAWRMTPEEKGESDHTHRWTLSVRSAASVEPSGTDPPDIGGADDLGYFIKRVTFKLHDTYPTPLRSIDKPPFEVTETGWGEFEVQIRIFFVNEAGEKPIGPFMHFVKLHPWQATVIVAPNNIQPLPPPAEPEAAKPAEAAEGEKKATEEGGDAMEVDKPPPKADEAPAEPEPSAEAAAPAAPAEAEPPAVVIADSPVHSYQYDEIVFHEPLESFYNVLLAHPPTPLPQESRVPKADPLVPLGVAGNVGELTLDTEKAEAARLDHARIQTLAALDDMRRRIAELEEKKAGKKVAEAEAAQ